MTSQNIQELNKETTQEVSPKCFSVIHNIYQEALVKSKDILDIVYQFRHLLKESDILEKIPYEERDAFFKFISGVDDCYYERKSTFKLTNIMNDITTLIMYIILFYNSLEENTLCVDTSINSRRKSLKRDLAKILKKAFENDTSGVKDRFGLRVITLNNNLSKTDSETLLLSLGNFIIEILTHTHNKYYAFMDWVNDSNLIDDFTKLRLMQTLSLPFKLDRYKNYVSDPKKNRYQSVHATIILPVYSKICPGSIFDLQFRTFDMHQEASYGEASHSIYEEKNLKYTQVFEVDDFSKLNIIGFSGNNLEQDIDGINNAKAILNRRISTSLVN